MSGNISAWYKNILFGFITLKTTGVVLW